eukprot:300297_1
MIDPSLDSDFKSFPSYLSSWDYSRLSLDYIIPSLDDSSTFREWWLPSTKNTNFHISNRCQACEPATDASIAHNVVYYTEGSNFCYTWFTAGNPCAQNINEYACNVCDLGEVAEDTDGTPYWSTCSALQISADAPSLHHPDMRVNHHLVYRPVMSVNRKSCTCYQISDDEAPIKHTVYTNELPIVTVVPLQDGTDVRDTVDYIDPSIVFEAEDEDETSTDCAHTVHYLTQLDFLYGTYRIRECGEYIFTEDITCNFNAPTEEEEAADGFSPNSITADRLYWFPTAQQQEEYPGLFTYEGSYSLGFFAGITVECDDVIINLNGFSFEMHPKFYLQQRFFSLIELAAKPFLPHQGASSWGVPGQYYAQNVEIKGPGSLGLSSHHGIHGNNVMYVDIHDLDIHHFDVAGIGCNACQYLTIGDVAVGPQNNQIPTLGRFTHSRAFIPRLKDLYDHHGDKEVAFYGRDTTTVAGLCSRMIAQLDMMYHHWIDGAQYDEEDEEWIAAQKLFSNPTGWMDGGTSYGISLNGYGAAVVGIGTRTANTNNIVLNNVKIFGIYNQNREKIKFTVGSGTSRGILFDVTDWIGLVDQIEEREKTQYIGDVFMDIQFAANKFMESWYYRNSLFIDPIEESFVFDGNLERNGYPFLSIFPYLDSGGHSAGGCGTDIQLHSPKGAIGLMVNGAQHSRFRNIHISDVYNWADLGLMVCGPYEGPHLSTEDIDIAYGYTGTRATGMVCDFVTADYEDIVIQNVESWNGEANGWAIYKQSYINVSNVVVSNIHAGTKLTQERVDTLTLPNYVPRACAVDVHDETEIHFKDGRDVDNIRSDDVVGFDTCDQFPITNNAADVSALSMVDIEMAGFAVIAALVMMIGCVALCRRKTKKRENTIISEVTPLLI